MIIVAFMRRARRAARRRRARLGVEVGGGLVHDEQLGLTAQRDGDEQLLLLAARELEEGLRSATLRRRGRGAAMRFDALRVVPETAAEKRSSSFTGIFSGGGSCGTKPTRLSTSVRCARGALAANLDLPAVRVLAEQAANHRRLAGAVGADQRDALAQLDVSSSRRAPLSFLKVLERALRESNHGRSRFVDGGSSFVGPFT
jgi:hypothetical protein